MHQFEIRLRSVQDVQEFVALATGQSFAVLVGDGSHKVSGQCFMEMFCLDFTRPLIASVDCTEEEFQEFRIAAVRFWAK